MLQQLPASLICALLVHFLPPPPKKKWSLIRTTVTKTVEADEVGKVFSAMALIAAVTPMIVTSKIKKVYNATLEIFPSAYLIMAASFYLLAVALNYTLFVGRQEIDDPGDNPDADDADERETERDEEEEES